MGPVSSLEAPTVEELRARAFTVPTESPEGDGTLEWDSTSIVIVEARAAGVTGLGYSYGSPAAVHVILRLLQSVVLGADALAPQAAWAAMRRAIRNAGYPGIGSAAMSALDVALWDLKARLLDTSLCGLLGRVRREVPLYGSGGFTTYDDEQLAAQLEGWMKDGITAFKIKVGAQPEDDLRRVAFARKVIGDARLFVDANGAYSRKQALRFAIEFAVQARVSWFEEPVSSDDLEGLRVLRDRSPAGMDIAAGEYGYDLFYFRRMLDAGAVDVLQADVTRCGGITQFLQVGALCSAHGLRLSAHTSPTLHAHVCACVEPLEHVEYFHDHARIERMFFDGMPAVRDGTMSPDPSVRGMGLSVRESDVTRFACG